MDKAVVHLGENTLYDYDLLITGYISSYATGNTSTWLCYEGTELTL